MAIPIHRIIYEHCYGPIPVDEAGRTYEIHHIDGDHANNHPANLQALSIQEHYDIHLKQRDYGAAQNIALRMNISHEEKSKKASELQLTRSANGTRVWQDHEKQSAEQKRRVELGIHNFLGANEYQRKLQKSRLDNGTHHNLIVHVCPHPRCGKIGRGPVMYHWHFDNCRLK